MKKYIFTLLAISLQLVSQAQPGTIDPSFHSGSGFSNVTNAIALQSDGRILVGGDFSQYNDSVRNRLVRLWSDGSLDTNFNIGTGFSDVVRDIKIQSDGRILVCGNFTHFNGNPQPGIIRLLSNGLRDTSFHTGSGFNSLATSLGIQSDGKILVGGCFTSYNGNTCNGMARLNTDGTFDPGFNIGLGFSDCVNTLEVQSDDKVVAGGYFTQFNGAPSSRLIRLNPGGSLDAGFTTNAGGIINDIKIQPDGKLVIGGNYFLFNSTPASYITRLETNGSLDVSWINSSPGFNGEVYQTEIQSDGKIVAVGRFSSFSGTPKVGCARLNTNGSLDNTFAANTDGWGVCLAIQPNDRIVLGGYFTNVNGSFVSCITRLLNSSTPSCATSGSLSMSGTAISCSSIPVLVSALFTGGSVDSVRWFRNGNPVPGTTGSGTAFSFNRWAVGTYYATGYCGGTAILTDSITFNTFDIRVVSGSPRLCTDQTVTLEVDLIPGAVYEWTYGSIGGTVLGNLNTITLNGPGTPVNIWCKIQQGTCRKYKKIKLSTPASCSTIFPRTAAAEESEIGMFVVYPNPAGDKISLFQSAVPNISEVSVSMYNVQGALVYRFSKQQWDALAPETIDVSNLPRGTYLLQIVTPESSEIQKILLR